MAKVSLGERITIERKILVRKMNQIRDDRKKEQARDKPDPYRIQVMNARLKEIHTSYDSICEMYALANAQGK